MNAFLIKLFRAIFGVIMTVTLTLSSSILPPDIPSGTGSGNFGILEYPSLRTLESAGISEAELKSRADAQDDIYSESRGYSDIGGLTVSPYYTATVAGTAVPVYSATVFLGTSLKGALHSFSEIYFEPDSDISFNIELTPLSIAIRNALVLPKSLNVEADCSNGRVKALIEDFGTYTFLFNDAGQEYAYTLFVREKTDEDSEIAKYKSEYGAENVIVFDKGVYNFDYINIENDNTVIFLKDGAYLEANHMFDIMSDDDDARISEDGASEANGIGLWRYPFINFHNCNNVKIVGHGVIDLSALDRHERRGVVFTFCNNVEVSGIKIINAPEWSFITYQCENVSIENTDVFGYRINSDAFAICNSRNVTVNGCFARSGDDLFDVKTLGGSEDAVSDGISFTNCIAWAGKARCFGICGEVNRRISNVSFSDCAVIYRDGTWSDDRIASLAVVVEQGGGSISDVLFENIEIFRDDGRAICCTVYGEDIENFTAENIVFKNISYISRLPVKVASNGMGGNKMEITIDGTLYRA